jgi:hypothetical protein
MLKVVFVWIGALALATAGCGASHPPPTDNLASAIAAVRAAQEAGAADVPKAALQLKLAEEQVAQARAMIEDGEHERADYMTLRAFNDAELARALARQHEATTAVQRASAEAQQGETPRQ